MTKQTADQAYKANKKLLNDRLAELQKLVKATTNKYDTECLHWGHVGSIGKLADDIQEVIEQHIWAALLQKQHLSI